MKIIDCKAELLKQGDGLDAMFKHIELCGRVSYKSEDRMTKDSSIKFVENLIKSSHTSVLEHGTVYLKVIIGTPTSDEKYFSKVSLLTFFKGNPYSKVVERNETEKGDGYSYDLFVSYITTNYRVVVENNLEESIKPYICDKTCFHKNRFTMKFTTDRGVTHEIVRHRKDSFTQEAQRFCNYMSGKFNMSVTFIQPPWLKESDQEEFEEDLKTIENLYFKYLDKGYKPEEARYFLINGTKTEICVTGFDSDWKHFFDLRYYGTTGKPSPDMLCLTKKAKEVLEENGILFVPKKIKIKNSDDDTPEN